VKSLQLEQKPIDPIEQGESTKDPPLEHVYQDGEKKEDAHKSDGGKGRDKLKNRRLKLSFKELLAKYEKIAEANVNNRPKKVQSSKSPPKHKFQEWNWQDRSHTATTYSPFEQSIPCHMDHSSHIFILIHLEADLIKRHMFHHILGHNM
jgi:hypothetical protein